MNTTSTARPYGIIGTIGGVALVLLAVLQLAGDVSEALDSTLAAIGFVGLAIGLVGLLRLGATPTRVGRTGLVIWIVGLLAIAAGGAAATVFGLSEDANLMFPLGGLCQTIGGLMAGISIARAHRVEGALRWTPLLWAIVYVAMLPFGFSESAAFAAIFTLFGLVALATPVSMLRGVTVHSAETAPVAAVA